MLHINNSQVKILLVDDTPENLEVAGKLLAKQSYDIYLADSGKIALELIKKISFDLILLDIMMPEMDGFEVCRVIKSKEENLGIPIIFLTAKVELESVIKAFQHGAVDYIRKPYNAAELLARVHTHVELKKTREELELKNKNLEVTFEALKAITSIDPLTKLFNPREVLKKMEDEKIRCLRSKRPFCIIIVDIDFFKAVNDKFGHACGDEILVGISDSLKNNLRRQDYLCRWGGEEFLIMLLETELAGAQVVAEKLRKNIQDKRFHFNNEEVSVTATFGISLCNPNEPTNQAIAKADKAMCEGKQGKKNCVVVYKD